MRRHDLPQLLLDQSPDALLILSQDGHILSWNRGAERMFGYTSADALGRRMAELTAPDHITGSAWAAQCRALVSGNGSSMFEALRRRKDGALIPVEVAMPRVDGLTTEGYDVRTATAAEDALAVLRTFTPRLILIDLQLPGMDGLIHPTAQGRPAAAGHPDHRPHRLRHEGRRAEGARVWVRWLCQQTDRHEPPPARDQVVPLEPAAVTRHVRQGSRERGCRVVSS